MRTVNTILIIGINLAEIYAHHCNCWNSAVVPFYWTTCNFANTEKADLQKLVQQKNK